MSRWLLAAAAVVAVAGVREVRADALSDARKAVDGSDYPTAKTSLDAALKAGTAGPGELAEIYRLSGVVEAALGDAQGATGWFAKWLSVDAKASLADGTSPKIKRPFDAALAQAKKRGPIEVKSETDDDPPAITLVVVNDPHKLIAGARVYFRVDKRAEQALSADLDGDRARVELETGKRLDVRLQAVDEYGNRVVELGSRDVPIVITSSGKATQLRTSTKGTPPAPTPVTPAAPRSWYAQWWVWGIATGVAAGVGGFFAWRTHGDVEDLSSLNANSYAHPFSDAQAVERRANRDLLITDISAGVAGAFAIGTILLYLTRPDEPHETEPRAAVTPITGGGAVVLGGHF